MDVLLLGLALAFFIASWALIEGLDRL